MHRELKAVLTILDAADRDWPRLVVTWGGCARHRMSVDVHQEREDVYMKYADEFTRFATGLAGPSDAADLHR